MLQSRSGFQRSNVSVRPDRSAAHRESAIVSANDSGHYGFLDGASYKAALDRRREAVDLFSDDGIGHIGCPGGASICDECEPDFQLVDDITDEWIIFCVFEHRFRALLHGSDNSRKPPLPVIQAMRFV